MFSDHGARPTLKPEIVSEADKLSQSDVQQKRAVGTRDDTDLVEKLMNESCPGCKITPRHREFGNLPSTWSHLPWDEAELRKHCPEKHRPKPEPERELPYEHGKFTFLGVSFFDDEKAKYIYCPYDPHPWQVVVEEPPMQCIIETIEINENLTVKRLADGGRLIEFQSNTGCQLCVLEDARGKHLLVSTRCCGKDAGMAIDASLPSQSSTETLTTKRYNENNDGVAADAFIPSLTNGSTEQATTTQSGANDDGMAIDASIPSPSAVKSDRSNIPPSALTSKRTCSPRVDPPTFLVPHSWSSDKGEPKPFELIVADTDSEANQVAQGRSAAVTDSAAPEELPMAEPSRLVSSKPSVKHQEDMIEPEQVAPSKVSLMPIVGTSPENREGEGNRVRMAFKLRVRLRRQGRKDPSKKD